MNNIFFLLLLFLCFEGVSIAGTVLQWDENIDADYYIVYWGDVSEDYSEGSSVEIPSGTTTFLLSEPTNGETYYYSVRAFNRCGNSSEHSAEVEVANLPGADSFSGGGGTIAKSAKSSSSCFIDTIIE